MKLQVSEKQQRFVAGSAISIIKAYIAAAGNGFALLFRIHADHTPAGFLMIGFDADDGWNDAPPIAIRT